jgi:hypothetical protein
MLKHDANLIIIIDIPKCNNLDYERSGVLNLRAEAHTVVL